MIKIFSQSKIIYLLNDRSQYKANENSLLANISSEQEMKLSYEELILKNKLNEISFYHDSQEELKAWFFSMFRIIEAAGGLVRNKREELLFIKRHGKWDLPKGKIEKGESVENAAMREVEEECGISGLKIINKLTVTYHTYLVNEEQVLKPTHWFRMETADDAVLVPQEEEGITEVRWISEQGLGIVRENTFASIAEVLTGI